MQYCWVDVYLDTYVMDENIFINKTQSIVDVLALGSVAILW